MSGGLGRKGEAEIECPFCKKAKIRMFHKEGYLQPSFSRISAKSAVKYHRVPDTYEVLENCPNCGKTKKEIQKNLEGKTEIDHKKTVDRIKKQGLPTQIKY